jgi:hypothetical protein
MTTPKRLHQQVNQNYYEIAEQLGNEITEFYEGIGEEVDDEWQADWALHLLLTGLIVYCSEWRRNICPPFVRKRPCYVCGRGMKKLKARARRITS